MEYPNIKSLRDGAQLCARLEHEALKIIDNILAAYNAGKIDVSMHRYGYSEWFNTTFDAKYEKTGYETAVLKWLMDIEDTDFLIDVFTA